jgi:hypothetical protein
LYRPHRIQDTYTRENALPSLKGGVRKDL